MSNEQRIQRAIRQALADGEEIAAVESIVAELLDDYRGYPNPALIAREDLVSNL